FRSIVTTTSKLASARASSSPFSFPDHPASCTVVQSKPLAASATLIALGEHSSISTFIPDAPSACSAPLPAPQSRPRASRSDTARGTQQGHHHLPPNPPT